MIVVVPIRVNEAGCAFFWVSAMAADLVSIESLENVRIDEANKGTVKRPSPPRIKHSEKEIGNRRGKTTDRRTLSVVVRT